MFAELTGNVHVVLFETGMYNWPLIVIQKTKHSLLWYFCTAFLSVMLFVFSRKNVFQPQNRLFVCSSSALITFRQTLRKLPKLRVLEFHYLTCLAKTYVNVLMKL